MPTPFILGLVPGEFRFFDTNQCPDNWVSTVDIEMTDVSEHFSY